MPTDLSHVDKAHESLPNPRAVEYWTTIIGGIRSAKSSEDAERWHGQGMGYVMAMGHLETITPEVKAQLIEHVRGEYRNRKDALR